MMLLAKPICSLPVQPEGSKRVWANFSQRTLEGDAVLEGHGDGGGEGVHQAGDGGAFLGHADEDLAGLAVGVEADGEVALVAGDGEFVGDGGALGGQAVTDGREAPGGEIGTGRR